MNIELQKKLDGFAHWSKPEMERLIKNWKKHYDKKEEEPSLIELAKYVIEVDYKKY